MNGRDLDLLCINTIRTLAIDAIQKANSGHPGLPLGAAPMAYVLWQRHLRHDPQDPSWPDRDRFVLSPGHGSMLLYALLHLTGYDLSLDDLKAFRQWGSRTPGHPEVHLTPGVEATTGPLGQGTANAVGMAMAERALAALFNRPDHTLVDHFTYALVSDGDLMEGVAAEAASLAGHLKLGKLIYLYDANDVSLDGPTSLTFNEDVAARYRAYGWHVQSVTSGDSDLDAIDAALTKAKAHTQAPSLIIVKTTIGYGSPNKQGTSASHGSPLGPDEVRLTKKALGWDPEAAFHIPDSALEHLRSAKARGGALRTQWRQRLAAYTAAHPEAAALWQQAQAGRCPEGLKTKLPRWQTGESLATRKAGGLVLNAAARELPWLLGGDADLGCSTQTVIKDGGSFDGATGKGRNIHFGVREHAMGAIANGMLYHGGVRPFVATFFVFSDYMRPAVRLAAMNKLPAIYVWTHDSLGVGEDGPTHQPIEHLMSLRAMPNLLVLRPADAQETAEAWHLALQQSTRPTALVLTRQNLPVLDRASARGDTSRGAYVLREPPDRPQVILMATGSEVATMVEAHEALLAQGVPTRVVSMPSWELFAEQPQAYRDEVLPRTLPLRVSLEAGVTLGWERWLGAHGVALGIDRFGASAPGEVLMEKYGLTSRGVCDAARRLLAGA